MKIQLLAAAAATTLIATLGLTACASDTASADCLKVSSGSVSDSVAVEGEFGGKVTVTPKTPLVATKLQRTVVTKGAKEVATTGQGVEALVSIFNGTTGESVYAATQTLNANDKTLVDGIRAGVDCLPMGSRSVSVMAASDLYSADVLQSIGLTATDPIVAVIDLLSLHEEPVVSDWTTGVPAVTFGTDGQPKIDLNSGSEPEGIAVKVLKPGTGATVTAADSVKVNYFGVNWVDGVNFDGNYGKDPAEFALTGVIAGFRVGLIGQKVGSQLLLSIPAKYAYGEGTASQSNPKAGQDLLFLIDIVDVAAVTK